MRTGKYRNLHLESLIISRIFDYSGWPRKHLIPPASLQQDIHINVLRDTLKGVKMFFGPLSINLMIISIM